MIYGMTSSETFSSNTLEFFLHLLFTVLAIQAVAISVSALGLLVIYLSDKIGRNERKTNEPFRIINDAASRNVDEED